MAPSLCSLLNAALGLLDLELHQRGESSTDDGGGRESDYSRSGDEDVDESHPQANAFPSSSRGSCLARLCSVGSRPNMCLR